MHKLFAYTALVAAAAAIVLTILLLLTWLEHRRPLELPALAGSFHVGRTAMYWTKSGASDTTPPNDTHELVGWIWYPTTTNNAARAPYLPPKWREALEESSGALIRFITRDLAQVKVHSVLDAELAATQPRYPIILLRAGSSALVANYTALAEQLASRGYIVVGVDAAYRTAVVVLPNGQVVRRVPQEDVEVQPEAQQVQVATRLTDAWSADLSFVVDELAKLDANDPTGRFRGRLDTQRVGVVGHSFGGAHAADFCFKDSRCKAGVDLDGRLFGPVIDQGLQRPFMFVLSEHDDRSSEGSVVMKQIDSVFGRLPAASRLMVILKGSNHLSFSDQILLKSQVLIGTAQRLHLIGGLEPRRGLAISSDYVATFFDVYLNEKPRTELEALGRKYPEVIVH
ncbi:MAG TPA: hypothetical protein VFS24_07635 [Steroidobacteraceae bacterium]|nr:hypothetical protein [Steroidobacteraceae bacterium]